MSEIRDIMKKHGVDSRPSYEEWVKVCHSYQEIERKLAELIKYRYKALKVEEFDDELTRLAKAYTNRVTDAIGTGRRLMPLTENDIFDAVKAGYALNVQVKNTYGLSDELKEAILDRLHEDLQFYNEGAVPANDYYLIRIKGCLDKLQHQGRS